MFVRPPPRYPLLPILVLEGIGEESVEAGCLIRVLKAKSKSTPQRAFFQRTLRPRDRTTPTVLTAKIKGMKKEREKKETDGMGVNAMGIEGPVDKGPSV